MKMFFTFPVGKKIFENPQHSNSIRNSISSNLKTRVIGIANLMISSQFVLSNNENHFTSVAQKSVLLSEQNKKSSLLISSTK